MRNERGKPCAHAECARIRALLPWAESGDCSSREELWTLLLKMTIGLARYRFPYQEEDCDDLVQDSLLALAGYEARHGLCHVSCFQAFLRQVVQSRSINWFYRHRRAGVRISLDAPVGGGEDGPTLEELLGTVPNPVPLDAEELARICLESLLHAKIRDPRRRALIFLLYVRGNEQQEIGAMFDIPIATVNNEIDRAKKRIRGVIEEFLGPVDASLRILPKNFVACLDQVWGEELGWMKSE